MKPPSTDARPKLVFFGTEQWGAPILEELAGSFQIKAVVTKPDAVAGRSQKIAEPPIKQVANRLNLNVIQPERLLDIREQLHALQADLGVLIAYGRLVPADIIDLFPYGIINGHPSLLPKYRGPAPIENIILNHDQPGFSFIQLSSAMDAGDILYSIPLTEVDQNTITSPELYSISGLVGAKIVSSVVQKVLNHTIKPIPQNPSQATYTKLIHKTDGAIDWTKSADQIEKQVRAYAGWPGSHTELAGTDITITKAHSRPSEPDQPQTPGTPFKTLSGELAVACGQNVLIIDSLKPAGKTEMTGKAFLSGRRHLLS